MSEPARILVVCTANVCRSPLGQALLTRLADAHVGSGVVDVTSAGTHARAGEPAARGSRRIADRWGVDLGGHRSRPLGAAMVSSSDLVLTMEEGHREMVLRLAPRALPRTFTWVELARLATRVESAPISDPIGSTLPERLAAAARAAHRLRPLLAGDELDDVDVADPIGQPTEQYQRMASTLVDTARSFVPLLLLGQPMRGRREGNPGR